MAGRLSITEHILRLFTDIRPREGRTAILLFLNVFLILCAYYMIKPLREGWIGVTEIGSLSKWEIRAYTSFGQVLVLVPVTALYGRLSERWPRRVLITRATLVVCAVQLVFWPLEPGRFIEPMASVAVAFYLWVGMFGVFIVAQFWAFAADLYSDERGRRMIPFIAVGATSGATLGATVVGPMVESSSFGTGTLLLMVNVPLLISIALSRAIDTRGPLGDGMELDTDEPELPEPEEDASVEVARGFKDTAIGTVLTTPYLLPIAIVTLLVNWVNTNGENLLYKVVIELIETDVATQGLSGEVMVEYTKNQTTLFYGNFYMWVNIVALFLQTLVASRMLKYGGFAVLMMALPTIALASYVSMALVPILMVVKWMKVAENSTEYSLFNTARHVFWLPVSPEETYKGKTTIDSLFHRAGDGLAALTVLFGVQIYALATEAFFAFNVALVLIMFIFSMRVVREHAKLVTEQEARESEERSRRAGEAVDGWV